MPQFEVVQNDDPTPEPKKPQRGAALDTNLLLLSLKVLSQRALAGVRAGFTLFTVGLTWWLWYGIPDPSPTQIVSLLIFALFILAANVIVRKI